MFRIIKNNTNLFIISSILSILFIFNITFEYQKYKELSYEEIFETEVEVLNIYKKEEFDVFKLQSSNLTFFTSFPKHTNIQKLDTLNIAILTTKVDFLDYLKGFYTKTIYFDTLEKQDSLKNQLSRNISIQHEDILIKELFNALFLAIPISSELRDICAKYGISHLIALSGFHLGVLSFIIYWILYFPYSFFHTRYFPYRNKKFDILLASLVVLFFYLILTNIVPSLFRAFIMLVVSILLLRSNIKLFSFLNLFIVLVLIIAIYPKLIFSLSLWFSIAGVFYILLYVQYFKNIKNKYLHLIFFNIWIFVAMNVIVHFFFPITSYFQLLSPLITVLFTFFYPIELFLHFINQGSLLDDFLLGFLKMNFEVYDKVTALSIFIVYVVLSLLSIYKKFYFNILIGFIVLFNIYLFF